jgi:hypothetical protein
LDGTKRDLSEDIFCNLTCQQHWDENHVLVVPERVPKLISILKDVESILLCRYAALKALLPVLRFRLDDVEAWELDQGIASQEIELQRQPPHQEYGIPVQSKSGKFFTREGEYWHIGFEGRETRIKQIHGLLYISYLLEKPGTSIPCRELYQAAAGGAPSKIMSEGAAIGQGFNIGRRTQAASDYQAKQNYGEKYKKLENDLDNVEDNPEGGIVRKEIEKEMEAIIRYLKERPLTDKDTAKSQNNVQRRLDTAYAAIRKAGMKEMEKHLREHIKTDGAYGLTYTGAAAWEITI